MFKKWILLKIKSGNNSDNVSNQLENKIIEKKIKNKNLWPLSKIAGRFVVWYAIAILIGTILLASPICLSYTGKNIGGSNKYEHNYEWDFLSSLFTASSSFSDTGLTVVNVAADYNFLGQLIIAILIEIGGFGIITFKVMFFIFIGKKLTLKDRLLAQGERGSTTLGGTIQLIKSGFIFLIVIEIIATIALFGPFYFYKVPDSEINNLNIIPEHNFLLSLWSSIFCSISAINNAGFDIIGKSSLAPYNKLYIIQFIFMLEFIIGGIGFPTFYDILRKIKSKYNKTPARLTLFTKLNLITYAAVSIVGLIFVFSTEGTYHGADGVLETSTSGFNFFMNIFFNVMSTRNAGFSTIDCGLFRNSSKFIMSIMMFIGSAPSSTAGGIRTTTLSVIILTIFSVFKNGEVTAFKKQIPSETVKKSSAVFILSIVLLLLSTLITLSIYENSTDAVYGGFSYIDILFLYSSAFGTTGLSTLSTENMLGLTTISKIILILLMIIGQIGISNVLSMFKVKNKKEYKLVEENLMIG